MSADISATVVGALTAFAGVLIGTVVMPWMRERDARRRAARYLAIRVVCMLDEYIDDFAAFTLNSGYEDRDGNLHTQIAETPAPSYPTDLDCRIIEHELMYELLSFPNAAKKVAGAVNAASEMADGPDFADLFETRSIAYGNLGLRADTLATKLRERYRIPPVDHTDWDPVAILRRVVKETEERRLARFNALAAAPSLL
jgi:hypothetical protein